jgi:TatD DNase family protein
VRFVDSHLHLAEYENRDRIVAYALSSETLLLSAAVGKDSSVSNLEQSKIYPGTVRAFVGVHPSEVSDGISLEWMPEAVAEAAGVGETGLDPKYSEVSDDSVQMKFFLAQLRLAEEQGKPVQVHSRGAERTCAEKLASFGLRKVLLHWFEGEEIASLMADRGYFVSFGPALLYSKKLSRIATEYPEDLVLTETDGPVEYTPLGGVCGPFLIPSVVFRLAELRKKRFDEMAELVLTNSLSFLGEERKDKGLD